MFSVRNKLISLLLLTAWLSTPLAAQSLPPLTHGLTPLESPVPAPPLQLSDLDEEPFDLADLQGKVRVVNFWATWCPPCRREMGSLERLQRSAEDQGVEVIAVNVGEDADTVFSFLGTVEPSPTFTVVLDLDGESMQPWKVRGLPTTFIVGPDNQVYYRAVGGREFDHPELVGKLLELTN